MIDKISVKITIRYKEHSILKALHESTNIENKLAPKNIKIKQQIRQCKLVFESEISELNKSKGTIDSFRRTVDDFIFSLNLAYQSIMGAMKYEKNKVLRDNRTRSRGHCCNGSKDTI